MNKEKNTKTFWEDGFSNLKGNKFPWFDPELMLSNYRRNVDLINTTQQIAAETTKAVIQLQAAYMKDVFEQMSEQSKRNISTFSPEENIEQQSQATRASVDHAMDHARNINSIITKSGEEIMQNVQKRFKEGVNESTGQTSKEKPKHK